MVLFKKYTSKIHTSNSLKGFQQQPEPFKDPWRWLCIFYLYIIYIYINLQIYGNLHFLINSRPFTWKQLDFLHFLL